jgi:hypothetical protein
VAPDPDSRRRLVEAVGGALSAASTGDDETAVQRLIEYIRESPDGHADARDLVLLLFHECSQMVAALGSGGDTPVKMQVYDADGQEVPIDQADPPVRTAVRTLLAEVNGDEAAAQDQIEIALTSAAPTEVATVILQALRWTVRLSAECLHRSLPVTPWIADAVRPAPGEPPTD